MYHLAPSLIEAKRWKDLIDLLSDVNFLELTAKWIGPSVGGTGWRIQEYLHACLDPIPDQLKLTSRKLSKMSDDLASFAACLELFYVRGGGQVDEHVRCARCGERTIVHGHVDLGGVDFYDNYFSWCTTCFWSWHTEVYNSFLADPGIAKFDYDTNTYRH